MILEPVKFQVTAAVLLREDDGAIIEDGSYQSPPLYTAEQVKEWLDSLPDQLAVKAAEIADTRNAPEPKPNRAQRRAKAR